MLTDCNYWSLFLFVFIYFLMGTQIFSLSLTHDKKKKIFLHFFTELKTYHLS